MSFSDFFDQWRERQLWLPTWLDDKDWKTWILHAVITVAVGHFGAALAWFVVGPRMTFLDLEFGTYAIIGVWCMVAYYWYREVKTRIEKGWDYKPVDGALDVVFPIGAATVVTVLYLRA